MTQEIKMRRSLAILVVAATVASTVSFVPAQAAPVIPKPITATALQNGSIEQVREMRHRDRWRDDDRWRHRHHRRHNRDFFPNQFYFGFGFPYYAPRAYYRRHYQPYYGYGDCFRTWDGQLICR
jgi:hypothetical protein